MSLRKNNGLRGGVFWSILEKGGQQIVSFIVFIIIAGAVGPGEYGIASICFVYLLFAFMVLGGLTDALIINGLGSSTKFEELDVFWVCVFVGLVLSLGCFFSSGFLSEILNQSRLKEVLKLFSIVLLLVGVGAVPNAVLIKKMNFRSIAMRTLVASILSGFVGVYLAVNGYGAMAIVWQQIILYGVMLIVAWYSSAWHPELKFNIHVTKKLFLNGWGQVKVSMAAWVEQQIPRFAMVRIGGAESLGILSFALRLKFAINDVLVGGPLAVLFPAISQSRDNIEEQCALIKRVIFTVCFILFPVIVVVVGVAPYIVPALLGDRWGGAVRLIQVAVASLAIQPFYSCSKDVLRGNGVIGLYYRVSVLSVIVVVATSPILFFENGLIIFLCLGVLSQIISVVWASLIARDVLGIGLATVLLSAWSFVVSVIVWCIIVLFFEPLRGNLLVLDIFLRSIGVTVGFFVTVYLFDSRAIYFALTCLANKNK